MSQWAEFMVTDEQRQTFARWLYQHRYFGDEDNMGTLSIGERCRGSDECGMRLNTLNVVYLEDRETKLLSAYCVQHAKEIGWLGEGSDQ